MKRIITLLITLALAFTAFGQNPLDRKMEPFPELTVTTPTLQQAQALMDSDQTHLKCQGALAMIGLKPAKAPQIVVDALKGNDREYANAVLVYADELAGTEAIAPAIAKAFPKLKETAKADVLYWIGRNRLAALQNLIDESLVPGEAGEAAVFAALQLGGKHNKALLDALVAKDSPLSGEIRRLRGQAVSDDDDATRNSLRDSK